MVIYYDEQKTLPLMSIGYGVLMLYLADNQRWQKNITA